MKCVVEKSSGFPENTAKIIDNIVMEMQVGREIFIHTVDMYHEKSALNAQFKTFFL